jgi:hypothetical protein
VEDVGSRAGEIALHVVDPEKVGNVARRNDERRDEPGADEHRCQRTAADPREVFEVEIATPQDERDRYSGKDERGRPFRENRKGHARVKRVGVAALVRLLD